MYLLHIRVGETFRGDTDDMKCRGDIFFSKKKNAKWFYK